MRQMRSAIIDGTFADWCRQFRSTYHGD
jgi:hypothetical protein